ncbi:MAG: MBL fold metallo-hydrolase RNA specificity domain-containing protein, partial [Candidatus Natronoplasma sp.]
MNDLLKIDPVAGSIFVLSQSEPFDEEGEIQHEKLLNWCEHHGLPLYQVHASGHVMPHQLKDAIKKIDPGKVVPVHTERPELFKKYMSDLDTEIELVELNASLLL